MPLPMDYIRNKTTLTKLAEDVAKKSPSKNAKEEKETKAPWEEAVRKPSKKKKEKISLT